MMDNFFAAMVLVICFFIIGLFMGIEGHGRVVKNSCMRLGSFYIDDYDFQCTYTKRESKVNT
jgi:hypothetical protein